MLTKPIALYERVLFHIPFTEESSVNIYEIHEDYVLAGINNQSPTRCTLVGETLFRLGRLLMSLEEMQLKTGERTNGFRDIAC